MLLVNLKIIQTVLKNFKTIQAGMYSMRHENLYFFENFLKRLCRRACTVCVIITYISLKTF